MSCAEYMYTLLLINLCLSVHTGVKMQVNKAGWKRLVLAAWLMELSRPSILLLKPAEPAEARFLPLPV